MLKPCLLVAALGLTVLTTGCGPEELVSQESTTEPCAGTPEACAELEGRNKQLSTPTTTPPTTEPCAGTPEACAELERQKQLSTSTTYPTTPPCAGTPEACAELERQKQQLGTEPCGGTLEACGGLGRDT